MIVFLTYATQNIVNLWQQQPGADADKHGVAGLPEFQNFQEIQKNQKWVIGFY